MELKFPFGNNYGWGYKVSSKSKHLFYIFFKRNSITVMLQISKIDTKKELEKYNKLLEEGDIGKTDTHVEIMVGGYIIEY
jgi:hypothetical protein